MTTSSSSLPRSMLPVGWKKMAENLPEAIAEVAKKKYGVGVHDSTCPMTNVPALLIVCEDGENVWLLRNPQHYW